MQPEIVLLTPDEWPVLKTLRLQALGTDPLAFARSYHEEADFSDQEWRSKIDDANRRGYVAKIGDEYVGLAGVRFETAERLAHVATVTSVYVKVDLRGRGIGSALMKRVIADLHANPRIIKVELMVNDTQKIAKHLYASVGFKEAGVSRRDMKLEGTYYDATRMELIFEEKIGG